MQPTFVNSIPYSCLLWIFVYPGVGGFVLNNENQLLVIKERFNSNPKWKLPGGHAEQGT